MKNRLYTARLLESSPRYQDWRKILLADEVPLENLKSAEAQLGPEKVQVYKLNLERMERVQVDRLVEFIVDRFGASKQDARNTLEYEGFCIRAEDVVLTHDLRAFL